MLLYLNADADAGSSGNADAEMLMPRFRCQDFQMAYNN